MTGFKQGQLQHEEIDTLFQMHNNITNEHRHIMKIKLSATEMMNPMVLYYLTRCVDLLDHK